MSKNNLNQEAVIRELKKTLDAKTVELQRLKAVIEEAPIDLYWKDPDGAYLGMNPHGRKTLERMGFLPVNAKLEGLFDVDLFPEKAAKQYRENDIEVMNKCSTFLKEEFVTLASGEEVHQISVKKPLMNEDMEVVGIIGCTTDITYQKELEKKALEGKVFEKASEVKSEFIANMSHDLRTPMTGVLGMLQELSYLEEDARETLKDYPDAFLRLKSLLEKTSQNVSIAKESSDILLEMFNDILETIRLDSGKVDAEPEHFNLASAVSRQVNLLQATASDKQLDLRAEVDPSIPSAMFGLKRLFDRVLLNLISNALKFTKQGSVVVSVNPVGEISNEVGKPVTIEVRVTDTGIGIPKDKFTEIFENFSRLTSSYRGVYKGSGLGLYAVKRYVEAMNGEIHVESEEGKGSTFVVTLPFDLSDQEVGASDEMEEPIQPNRKAMNPPLPDPASPGARILVAEDNASAAVVVQGMLSRLGYQSDHAKTGAEAIELASQKDYKLILMDIGLPDMSGLDATVGVRQLDHPTRRKVPIVALTGHVDKLGMCLAAGMQDLFNKPAKIQDLERILMTYVVSADKSSAKVAVLDFKETIATLGSEETAKSVIKTCADDLKEHKEELLETFKARDVQKLRDLMHYMKGGVCYIKAPALMNALEAFHAEVKADPQDEDKLLKTYDSLLTEIDRFVGEVQERVGA